MIERYEGSAITDEMLVAAAKLFSGNYGVWGPLAAENMGKFAKQGTRVKMSAKKLREQVLPIDAENIYVRMMIDGELAGNVFGTRWVYEGRRMLWITQLCVSREHRNKGIAKTILENLRSNERAFGILSSHPFAILAVLRVYGRGSGDVDLEMTKKHARRVMDSCPAQYVKEAKLCGELFGAEAKGGTVSCADTQFWVDHEEPLEALESVKRKGISWPFGALPDGHEFLVLIKAEDFNGKNKENETSEF